MVLRKPAALQYFDRVCYRVLVWNGVIIRTPLWRPHVSFRQLRTFVPRERPAMTSSHFWRCHSSIP
jgi:hypothetical protein